MSQIRFFAFGGLAEIGKNMFIVEVDGNLFILDAGLKYPGSQLHGVEEIIPDYRNLVRVQDKIKGIFLSNAHEEHIGALSHILKNLNVPIFATKFTMEVIKEELKEEGYDLSTLKMNIINQNSIIKFGNVRITFFNTTYCIPESVGIAIQTLKGSIVYTSDFTFVQSGDNNYQTDFGKISELAEKNVLALIVESAGSTEPIVSVTSYELTHKLNSIFSNATDRILVSLYSSDLFKIQNVIDIAISHNKKIAIVGRKTQRKVDIAISQGYLKIPDDAFCSLKFIDDKTKNNDKNLVVLVAGSRHEPFYMLQRMCKKSDKLIHVSSKDTVVIMTKPISGTEKIAAKTLDTLFRSDAKVEIIDKRLLPTSYANADEVKMMISMLKPKYIIPVIGEYNQQYNVRKLAMELTYDEKQVFLMDNGDVLSFSDQPFLSKNDIMVGELLIDGISTGDINEFVVRDREILAEDGVLLLVAHIDPVNKKIIGDVEIVTKGFVYVSQSLDLLNSIKQEFSKVIAKHLSGKYVNWNEFKKESRSVISRFIFQEIKRNPITIPVLISVTDNKVENSPI